MSRLGFALATGRLEPAQARDYLTARLRVAGVYTNPFKAQALGLLIQAVGGLPRARSIIWAKRRSKPPLSGHAFISPARMQTARDRLPWSNALSA
jgi:hypothetical protein